VASSRPQNLLELPLLRAGIRKTLPHPIKAVEALAVQNSKWAAA
jgi:hypothetical protein